MRRPIVLASLALVLTACGGDPAPQAPPPPEVGVLALQPADVPLEQDLVGRLSPYRSADVRARVPGVLQRRVYAEGSDVAEGQVLFEIDPAPLRAVVGEAEGALAQAQANNTNARAAADRARRLAPQKYISQSDLDNALAAERSAAAALQSARAAVDSARINLGYATVRAPIAGRAGIQQVTEGALVGQGSTTLLTTVDQIDPLYVSFTMPVAELERLRASGLERDAHAGVRVLLADGSEYAHPGEVDFSGDVVDPATGAVTLRASLPNPERRLLPGAYVTLKANLGTRHGVYRVPQAAVLRDVKGAYVYLVGADGNVVRRDIAAGQQSGGDWIVDQGLAAGDQLIVSGVQKARAGSPAKPVPWTPAQANGAATAAQPAAGPAAPAAANPDAAAPAAPGNADADADAASDGG